MAKLLMCIMILLSTARLANAVPVLGLDGVPATYVPGQSFSFDVILTDALNLGAYNMDLVVESSQPNAGSDYFFEVGLSGPAVSNYVFPDSSFFLDSTATDSSFRHRITIGDFDFAGVNTVAGVNDRIATISLQVAASFAGTLELSIEPATLILDTPSIPATSIPDFGLIQASLFSPPTLVTTAIPEPSTLSFLAVFSIVCVSNRKRSGRRSI